MSKPEPPPAVSSAPGNQTTPQTLPNRKKFFSRSRIVFTVLVFAVVALVLLFSIVVPVKVTTCSLNLKDGMKEEAVSYLGFIPGKTVCTPTEYKNFADGTEKKLLLSVTKRMLFEERFHEVNTSYMLATLEGLWQDTFFDYKPELLQQKAALSAAFSQNSYAAVNRIINDVRCRHLPPD